jgi:hypothetical protein
VVFDNTAEGVVEVAIFVDIVLSRTDGSHQALGLGVFILSTLHLISGLWSVQYFHQVVILHVLSIQVRPSSRSTSLYSHGQISFPSSTLHLLVLFPLPTQRQRQLVQRNLHSEFVDHQLDIDILSAVGSESGKRVAQRRLELQSH